MPGETTPRWAAAEGEELGVSLWHVETLVRKIKSRRRSGSTAEGWTVSETRTLVILGHSATSARAVMPTLTLESGVTPATAAGAEEERPVGASRSQECYPQADEGSRSLDNHLNQCQ